MSLKDRFNQSVQHLAKGHSPDGFAAETIKFTASKISNVLNNLVSLSSRISTSKTQNISDDIESQEIHAAISSQRPSPETGGGDQGYVEFPASASVSESARRERRLEVSGAMLREVVKPAFARIRHKNVTEAGRKAIKKSYLPPSAAYDSDEARKSKPWKFGDEWVVDVFQWCLENLDECSLESNWPLLIPPILSLLDDPNTLWRVKGCHLLQVLLKSTPTALLLRTGMLQVFEQALLPCLQHLPPLTEKDEAEELLAVVYPTLLQMIRVGVTDQNGTLPASEVSAELLDRIIRQNILLSLKSASEIDSLGALLFRQLAIFLDEEQIEGVKHLRLLVPLVEEQLYNPFVTASPHYLYSILDALKSILLNHWPRIPIYCLKIASSLCTVWVMLFDEDLIGRPEYSLCIGAIKEDVRILRAILEFADEDLNECRRIFACDKKLEPLSKVWFQR